MNNQIMSKKKIYISWKKGKGTKKSLIIQKRKRNKHIYLQIKRDTKKKSKNSQKKNGA